MDTESICGQLIKAVRVQYDPFSPRASRLEAYKFIENFKQTSTPAQGIQCSIMLAQHQDRDIRHFGLKLLEDVIKLRWNDMNTEEKIFNIKPGNSELSRATPSGDNPLREC